MARLASQAKLGYYPTPVEVVAVVKDMLHIPEGARLLDPCCGEGEALAVLAEGTGARTYGVELDRERFKKASEVIDHVLWADALHEVTVSRRGFSLLWLNPPYDTDAGLGTESDTDRVEVQFLKKYWDTLKPGGVLVYIIPAGSVPHAAPFLSTRCRDLAVRLFPHELFWDYHQVIVAGVKARPGKKDIELNSEVLRLVDTAPYSYETRKIIPTITEVGLQHTVPVAELKDEELVFRSHRLDPDEAFTEVRKSSVWSRAAALVFPGTRHNQVSPLMPLREGHLAMLLASGMMNGEVVGEDGRKLVVKGLVRKVRDSRVEETEKETRYIETDRYEITVRAICFDPLEIIEIK